MSGYATSVILDDDQALVVEKIHRISRSTGEIPVLSKSDIIRLMIDGGIRDLVDPDADESGGKPRGDDELDDAATLDDLRELFAEDDDGIALSEVRDYLDAEHDDATSWLSE